MTCHVVFEPSSSPAVNFACRLHARASICVRAHYRPHARTRCVPVQELAGARAVRSRAYMRTLPALRTHALRARLFTAATQHVLNRKNLKINICMSHACVHFYRYDYILWLDVVVQRL